MNKGICIILSNRLMNNASRLRQKQYMSPPLGKLLAEEFLHPIEPAGVSRGMFLRLFTGQCFA